LDEVRRQGLLKRNRRRQVWGGTGSVNFSKKKRMVFGDDDRKGVVLGEFVEKRGR